MVEENVLLVQPGPLEGCQQLIAKNILVQLGVQTIVDMAQIAHALPSHTAPSHDRATTMLDGWVEMELPEGFTGLSPAVLSYIRPENHELAFVAPYNAFPLCNFPPKVPECKGISSLPVFHFEQG